ncbi:zinc finger protein 704-like [Hetaerina americana]|uniref:zinc finger protein 704-like n=1 Tax=Hetaerina americana TaxID=62018 RepID=UPI003A7F56EB
MGWVLSLDAQDNWLAPGYGVATPGIVALGTGSEVPVPILPTLGAGARFVQPVPASDALFAAAGHLPAMALAIRHSFSHETRPSAGFPWGEQLSPCGSDAALGSSWQSGTGRLSTPSPPLSSDGSFAAYNSIFAAYNNGSRWSTLNTTDEGIVIDDFEELPKKKKPMSLTVFQCTWPGCQFVTTTCSTIEQHVRNSHLGPRENTDDPELSDHEEEFYYTEVELADASSVAHSGRVPVINGVSQAKKSATIKAEARVKVDSGSVSPTTIPIASPPTLSHRDMARPPHEDPEYQRQLHSAAAQRHNHQVAGPINIPAETIMWSSPPTITSPASPQKYLKLSPKPSGLSPSRKVRGETKKCRKVYGMEHRELWCTQCKWKKACSRFGD